MSDEEGSISEGFSASEDEWKPSKDMQQRGGESSDDDDSDFEDSPVVGSGGGNIANRKRESEPKNRGSIKQAGIAAKKRKPMGQSLRTKLYNKYRPPPKTFPSPGGSAGNNSPSASTSHTASKNARTPNESSLSRGGDGGNDSSSESSVEDYLVNPAELDLQSSFFNVGGNKAIVASTPAPVFDCNAGMGNLSDSGSEDNESSAEERTNTKAFDFRNLLEKANSLERAKDAIAKRAADAKTTTTSAVANTAATMDDVSSLLALGEKQNNSTSAGRAALLQGESLECGPQKLSKTKSTRVKRHTKTRPTSTVGAGGDSDDSDWEEVAANDTEFSDAAATQTELSRTGLEIYVELPSKHRKKQDKKQQDLELALRRKLNRDLKERQLLLHKTSLLCQFGRSIFYNRLLNDTQLLQAALKLLPSQNAYPEEVGSSLMYYQSLMTWFKTAIKLKRPELYPEKQATKRKSGLKTSLLAQIKRKEADSKQDMVCMFVILLRGMGLQCRLVVNMQPLPLKPAQTDLLTIKLKRDASDDIKEGSVVSAKKPKTAENVQGLKKGEENATETKTKTENKHIECKEKLNKRQESNAKEKPKQREQKVVVKEKKLVEKGTVEEKMVTQAPEVKEMEKNVEEKRRAKPTLSKLKRPQADTKADTDVKKLKLSATNTAKTAIAFTPVARRTRQASTEQKTTVSEKPIIEVGAVKLPQIVLKGVKEISSKAAKAEVENKKLTITATRNIAATATQIAFTPVARRTRQTSTEQRTTVSAKPIIEVGAVKLPKIVLQGVQEISNNAAKAEVENEKTTITAATTSTATATQKNQRCTRSRSRSKSPQIHISTAFLQNAAYKAKFGIEKGGAKSQRPATRSKSKSPNSMVKISTDFLHVPQKRILRSQQKGDSAATQQTSNASGAAEASSKLNVPQLDGGDDGATSNGQKSNQKSSISKRPQLKKLQNSRGSKEGSDDDFQPMPTKKPKRAPVMPKKDRRIISSDEEDRQDTSVESVKEASSLKRSATAADLWVELWSDVEEQWICVDLFKGKLNSVEAIRKSASSSLAYVFAFQNNLNVKDVTARYCSNWTSTVRKSRVEKAWLDKAIAPYLGCRTPRDLREDQELRRIHEEKPMPNTISEYKDHPLYVLERHLLKFQAIYPPDPPTLGFVRGEAVYSRDCVHTLHSREIWLKQARTVKLGEQPYKIVKARPKWDRLTQTVIKDQPLEIFGYWQTQDYEPPTAENGVVPRNAYGNVELFKECMLPKKTVHLRLPGLNRVCKKLNIDCANAVIGFDFHQGACHPMFDGFVVCEEFAETVTAAWHQDQEEQERKEQEKYEARVYGNWKKLIRGLLIRERLKKKYNF